MAKSAPRICLPLIARTAEQAFCQHDRSGQRLFLRQGQSVKPGIPGNARLLVKLGARIGGNRVAGFGLAVGFKVLGFWSGPRTRGHW